MTTSIISMWHETLLVVTSARVLTYVHHHHLSLNFTQKVVIVFAEHDVDHSV